MNKKIKISFALPAGLQKDLKERMIKDGYDLKGKSKWVAEAVQNLLSTREYVDLVKIGDEIHNLGKLESVLIDRDLKAEVNKAAITIRIQYPDIEGVQSNIFRTAIIQRLLSGSFPPTGNEAN